VEEEIMLNHVQLVCVEHLEQYDWKTVLKNHYLSGLLSIQPIDSNWGLINLIFNPNTAKNRRRTDPFGLRRIDFSNSDDRWIFKKTIQEHLGSIVFLLQDEKFYAFDELLEAEFVGDGKIIGEGRGVIFVERQFIVGLTN
jgi:hypothetical protein